MKTLTTKGAARLVAEKFKLKKFSAATVSNWAKMVDDLEAYKDPFINPESIVIPWAVPVSTLETFTSEQCRKIGNKIRCNLQGENPIWKKTFAEFMHQKSQREIKEIQDKIEEEKRVFEKVKRLRSERKKGNSAKARELENLTKQRIRTLKYKIRKWQGDVDNGKENYLHRSAKMNYMYYLSSVAYAKIKGYSIPDKVWRDLGVGGRETVDKFIKEINKKLKSLITIAIEQRTRFKKIKNPQNFDLMILPTLVNGSTEISETRAKKSQYRPKWCTYFEGNFFDLGNKDSTKSLRKTFVHMEKVVRGETNRGSFDLPVNSQKAIFHLKTSGMRLNDFVSNISNFSEKENIGKSFSPRQFHHAAFLYGETKEDLAHDYPNHYLKYAGKKNGLSKISKIAKSTKEYPYWKKQPLKGNSFRFETFYPEEHGLEFAHCVAATKYNFEKKYSVMVTRSRKYYADKGWSVIIHDWPIFSSLELKEARDIIKLILKYYVYTDKDSVPIFDLEPLRLELEKI